MQRSLSIISAHVLMRTDILLEAYELTLLQAVRALSL